MKIERILIPSDFSEHALKALKYGIELACEHDAEIVLVHVVEPLPYGVARWNAPTDLLEHYGEVASGELKKLEQEALKLYPKCRSELHFGVPHEIIEDIVRKLNVDLVVLAMHGRTGLHHLLIGGTAEKLLRYLPCPVLRLRTD